jgi:hypothetical protein
VEFVVFLFFLLLQWLILRGCQVYSLVVNMVLKTCRSYDKLHVKNMIFIFVLLLCSCMNMEVISDQTAKMFGLFEQNLSIHKYGSGRFLWIWC